MFILTEAAKKEIANRFVEFPTMRYVRLQMRFSCLLKMRLNLEETKQPNDIEATVDGINFIIDKEHVHHFTDTTIDYKVGSTGFLEFDAIGKDHKEF